MKHTVISVAVIKLAVNSLVGCLLLVSQRSIADFPISHPAGFPQDASTILSATSVLPVEEAFRFGSYAEEDGMVVFWQVMPGYFLYRDKFQFLYQNTLVDVALPAGEVRQDEIFGEVMVLEGLVQVRLADVMPGDSLVVRYQGCASQGYCYPPQETAVISEK